MDQSTLNSALLAFLDRSPTPFHATANMVAALSASGFEILDERERWQLRAEGRYLVTRNGSSLIAFTYAGNPTAQGLRLVGAHTDSPCLKLKPHPEILSQHYEQLSAEVYGGVLLNPWFDRDLSLAGRVTLTRADGTLCNRLVDFRTPIAIIPSLAIHLDREANEHHSINKQTALPALIQGKSATAFDLKRALLHNLSANDPALESAGVEAFELCFYDTQPARLIGWHEEYLASARLDNLISCYAGFCALRDTPAEVTQLLVCNDHEEVGSGSTSGARGNFLESVLQRILGNQEDRARAMARSMLISTDNAHAIHPNFAERHDPNHAPILNGGPVLKTNANQSYATNSESAAILQHAARQAGIPLQAFVARADMGCGSTIGPLAATRLGIATVDVGVPTFAMHSIRELAGVADVFSLYRILQAFLAMPEISIAS